MESLREAVRLTPKDPDLRSRLALLLEEVLFPTARIIPIECRNDIPTALRPMVAINLEAHNQTEGCRQDSRRLL
jgi:hypothetical protein